MITVIDYGAGNLRSISNALRRVGADVELASEPSSRSDALVLPGVGHFGDAMGRLAPLRKKISETVGEGRPFLGLCLGLQVLLEGSEEAPRARGLGLLPGRCRRFRTGKVPHMGWNQVSLQSPVSSLLFDGVEDGTNFYFVHSYYAPVTDATSAACSYGADFSAGIEKKNLFACQFHPERSGEAGLRVLENFVKEARK